MAEKIITKDELKAEITRQGIMPHDLYGCEEIVADDKVQLELRRKENYRRLNEEERKKTEEEEMIKNIIPGDDKPGEGGRLDEGGETSNFIPD